MIKKYNDTIVSWPNLDQQINVHNLRSVMMTINNKLLE